MRRREAFGENVTRHAIPFAAINAPLLVRCTRCRVSLFTNYFIAARGDRVSRIEKREYGMWEREKKRSAVRSAKKKLKDDRVVCVRRRVIITIIDADRLFRHSR